MTEQTVLVAEFFSNEEAQGARLRLEAEKIVCVLSEETPSIVGFSVFGRLQYAPIQLRVAKSQAERARQILANKKPPKLTKNWESLAVAAVDGWICSNCDTQVEESATECPVCATPRRNHKKKRN